VKARLGTPGRCGLLESPPGLEGLSCQLAQSLRVMEGGLRPSIYDLESAPRNECSSVNAVSRRAPHCFARNASRSEKASETSTNHAAWVGWTRAAFILRRNNPSPRITWIKTDQDIRSVFGFADASPLIFAFRSPILRLNEAGSDDSLLATQLGNRKN